jgi:hypothetical protein
MACVPALWDASRTRGDAGALHASARLRPLRTHVTADEGREAAEHPLFANAADVL